MRQGPQKILTGSALDSRVAQFGQRSMIRSIQRGVVSANNTFATGTVTITAVDLNNTVLSVSQDGDGVVGRWDTSTGTVVLTNATTITVTRTGTVDSLRTSYEVIEYWPGVIKSVQRGTITLASVGSNTATITTVNMNKSQMFDLRYSTTELASPQTITTRLTLTNATTVTASRAVGTGTNVSSYQVVEFY
jgi:uncharacterized protein YycO